MCKLIKHKDKIQELGINRDWWYKYLFSDKTKKRWDEKPFHIVNDHLFLNRSLNNKYNQLLVEKLIIKTNKPLRNIKNELDVLLMERLVSEIPELKLYKIILHSNGELESHYEFPFLNVKIN